jgi:hypothetical protein
MTSDSTNSTFKDKKNPRHFMVLDAIARGIKDIEKISTTTRLPKQEVELIVNDLSLQRLVIKEEKKRRSFGGKKQDIKVSDTGMKVLHSKKQELEQHAEQLRQWQRNGDTAQLQSYMESDNNRSWMPFFIFSGIMDVLFFTSMMSMMGMALNPMESQIAQESSGGSEGGEGDGSAETETDTGSGSDAGGTGDVADTGGDFGGLVEGLEISKIILVRSEFLLNTYCSATFCNIIS